MKRGPLPLHAALLALGASLAAGLTRCNLYGGRSLDLFPTALELALECRSAKDCPRDRSLCARGNCVQCLLDTDCDRRHPACVGNTCVECRSAENCGARQSCNSVLNTCAPACTLADDCSEPATPQCSRQLGVCVQCVEDVDCTGPRDPVCDRGGHCVGCRSDADCASDAGEPACSPGTQRCERLMPGPGPMPMPGPGPADAAPP